MKNYLITIYNGAGVIIEEKVINAKDENEALLKFIKDAVICDGDTIKITEE